MLDLQTVAAVSVGAVLVGLYARRLVDTLDELVLEQRTTNDLLREQLHRPRTAREVVELFKAQSVTVPLDLDDSDPIDLDYVARRGGEG